MFRKCATRLLALPVVLLATSVTQPASGANAVVSCPIPTTGYGHMFPTLAAVSWSDADMTTLSEALIAPAEDSVPTTPRDAEENMNIAAGWTYFGQFIDHDLTFDNRPNDLTTPVDPATLINARTPQLDLDNVYGSLPTLSPTLYTSDGTHLNVGLLQTGSPTAETRDLPRNAYQQAVIGDPRDDENRMVAAIHASFIRLHNTIVDQLIAAHPTWALTEVFTKARAEVVTIYQTIVITEYLPTILDKNVLDKVLFQRGKTWQSRTRFYTTCAQMPIEFSVAAYRFGHSQVRSFYQLNTTTSPLPGFSGTYDPRQDVAGFQNAPTDFAVDWSYFLQSPKPPKGAKPLTGTNPDSKLQYSYRIDASLTNSLSLLPLPASGSGPANLAKRNVLRAVQLGLPSGQDVARQIGVTPLPADQILLGKATTDVGASQKLVDVVPSMGTKTPLWVYVLAEVSAHAYKIKDGHIVGIQRAPFTLGAVGSTVVAETFAGLLASDPASVLNTTTPAPQMRLWDVVTNKTPIQPPIPPMPPLSRIRR